MSQLSPYEVKKQCAPSENNVQNCSLSLSIVIVSWNTRDILAQCLQSVHRELANAFEPGEVETYVVDNFSTDGSVAALRREFPWVHLIENRENVGFARANNQAIALSQGRYVLLLNPDTVLHSGALRALVEFMELHPHAGAAGARLLNPDGSLQISCHPKPTILRELWRLFHLDNLHPYAQYHMAQWPVDKPRAVDIVQGAALIIRRSILSQLGSLDPDYFMYSEEVDLCHRIQSSGWRIYWVPAAKVTHYGGQSTQQVAAAMFITLYGSKIRYFRKHYGTRAAQAYKVILLVASAARLAAFPISWLAQPSQRARQRTLASHYTRLIATLGRL